jgi:hemerythrin
MTQERWATILDIGLPELDEQHKELIGYSNELLRAMADGHGKDVLEELFEKLLDYTDYHFAAEEAYMDSIGYPEAELHKKTHRKLRIDVGHFREKILSGQPFTPQQALDFINGWIVRHIMEMDTRVSVFAKKES